MADMFDDVSGRYDLLNRIMTLGRDQAWRRAMADQVPESARVVVDLCTGSGVSLEGLRRPGRLTVGIDVSLGMLQLAADHLARSGWAPRLVCADAFHLPVRDASLDAVTIAFGIRNLRPRSDALAEIARVLRPGGVLVVLEGTAPRPGPLAPFHRLYLERGIPFAGRLSPDPSAYQYLGRSILEFGAGPEFEADLARAGFAIDARHSFLFGATRMWSARRGPAAHERPGPVQAARLGEVARGEMRSLGGATDPGWRYWVAVQLVLSAGLLAALLYASWQYAKLGSGLPLEPWQRSGLRWLMIGGTIAFSFRTVVLWMRLRGPRPRR
jgi:demethylmenaquinone methyltransferase/2-methoxy-6-polyprenyl-1,4-benzoquinol methylase